MIIPTWDTVIGTVANTGARFPGTVADDATVGTIAWSNPGNATATDSSAATAVLIGGGVSHYLKCTNFGFNGIPANNTIYGIKVDVVCKDNMAIMGDYSVKLVKHDGTLGSESLSLIAWPLAYGTRTYGGPTDLLGYTGVTADNINGNSVFGVVISVSVGLSDTAYIDSVSITIYYAPTSNGPSYRQYTGGGAPFYMIGTPTGSIDNGTIDLNDRPIVDLTEPSSCVYFYSDSVDPLWYILSLVWLVGGVPTLLTEAEAITKFRDDGLHMGGFTYADDALAYEVIVDADYVTRYSAYPVVCLHGYAPTSAFRVQYPYRSVDETFGTASSGWQSEFYTDHEGATQYVERQTRAIGTAVTMYLMTSFNDNPHGNSGSYSEVGVIEGTDNYLWNVDAKQVYIYGLHLNPSLGINAYFLDFTPDPITTQALTYPHDRNPILFMRSGGVLSATLPMWEWLDVSGTMQWVNTGNATVSLP